MIFNASFIKKLTILLFVAVFLSGCLSTTEKATPPKRATLAELAQQPANLSLSPLALSQAERAKKLAILYQSILTLEPDAEIRTQIAYRLVQINSETIENNLYAEENEQQFAQAFQQKQQQLSALINDYKALLKRYPHRAENESIRYHLAKALALQGKMDESLAQMELLLAQYPTTQYAAELHFRRGEIYYNQQDYLTALAAYQAVLQAKNNKTYQINSMYMQGWSLFKLNRLTEADRHFIQLLDFILSEEKVQFYEEDFSFAKINKHYQNIANDVQRVLSISLSQQAQSASLLNLVKSQQSLPNLYLYQHILFQNLANFLLKNELKYDAELTYQAYIAYQPLSLWSARFSIALLDLYRQQGKNRAAQLLKQQYVQRYGLTSAFWQQARHKKYQQINFTRALYEEVLPHLIDFSYQHSRYLYADAQKLPAGESRVKAFSQTAHWLALYLEHAKLAQAKNYVNKLKLSQGLLADEFLYAEALFEAQQYQKALANYEMIAYQQVISRALLSGKLVFDENFNLLGQQEPHQLTDDNSGQVRSAYRHSGKIKNASITTASNDQTRDKISANEKLQKEAAYAATLTVRKLLAQTPQGKKRTHLLQLRTHLDQAFIEYYPQDQRALNLAMQAAQYAFDHKDHQRVHLYSQFILKHYGVEQHLIENPQQLQKMLSAIKAKVKTNAKALEKIQFASQLQANSLYQQGQFAKAELAYQLALQFIDKKDKKYKALRELIASSIYLQAQALKTEQPLLAVKHYLRLGELIPESSYRLNAEFDAANLLLAQEKWQQAIDTLRAFQQRYPQHEYSSSIPAKLANAYEKLGSWQLAAEQLLIIYQNQKQTELKREALYSAADYFLKAGNLTKAITTFRTYAHTYPEPFAIAQEVRFKMSEFYRQTKEPNKRFYWYRKLIKYHDLQSKKVDEGTLQRSLYLTSYAALELGMAHQTTFKAIKLNIPLKKSLQRKQKAMKRAIAYYQRVLTNELAAFVPHATYNLAQMYRQLARDVMQSQRPKGLDELALEEYELLLEEIAYPFEEKAIEIHTSNAQRAWQDIYDPWIAKSFAALAQLEPAQYNRQEKPIHAVQWLH